MLSPTPSPVRLRRLAAVGLTAAAVAVPAATASADPVAAPSPAATAAPAAKAKGPSRATLAKVVKLVAYERVYGSNYGKYKKRYPKAGIIWANDGCSLPTGTGIAVGYYAKVFRKSCDRHDFGYRNYGKKAGGLKLDPTSKRRASIDKRFHSNMDYQCQVTFKGGGTNAVKRGICYKASDLFYTAVRKGGGSKF